MSESVSDKKLPVKKIVKWSILGVIILLIVVILGTLLVQKFIMKKRVPTFMGYGYQIVITGSMESTIHIGDMVIVKATDDYKIGDIITFISSEEEGRVSVTHRIVNYDPVTDTFTTKGDFNNAIDKYSVSREQIVGEVVKVVPKVGLVLKWFALSSEGGAGIIYVVAFVAIIIAGVYFWQIINGDSEKEKDPDGEPSSKDDTKQDKTDKETDDKSKDSVELKKEEPPQDDNKKS